MKKFTKIWCKLLNSLAFKGNTNKITKLEQRINKLEKLNIALVKKLMSQGYLETTLPGENSTASRDPREERTIH